MISIPLVDLRPFNSWFSWFCSGLSLRKLWLGLMFSSVSELLALELSSIIVAGLASIEAFSWTEFDDILRGTSGSLAAGGGACSDSESESETEAAEAAEDLRTSAMTSAFWASSRWTVSRFELTISSFVNSSFWCLHRLFFMRPAHYFPNKISKSRREIKVLLDESNWLSYFLSITLKKPFKWNLNFLDCACLKSLYQVDMKNVLKIFSRYSSEV